MASFKQRRMASNRFNACTSSVRHSPISLLLSFYWRFLKRCLRMGRHFSTLSLRIVARMSPLFHLHSLSRRDSKDPDVATDRGSQNVEDRVSVAVVDDEPNFDINPGELAFEGGTLFKFLSI